MEIKRTKKSPAKIISLVTLAVILVALAGYSTYAFMAKTWPFHDSTPVSNNDTKNDDSSSVDKSSDAAADASPSTNDQDKTPTKYSPPSNSDDGSSDNGTSNANGINSSINYASVTDGTLKVRVTITELLDSGVCTLTLSNATTGTTTTYKTDIIANPSSSTCDGFNIPTKDLAKGDYNISVKLTSGDKAGTASSKVTI